MLKKLLSESGRRILRAIKKLSTRRRKLKRSQRSNGTIEGDNNPGNDWQSTIGDFDAVSLSLSLPSLDAKSIDTYMTYVIETIDDDDDDCCKSTCCNCCDEYEENQRNENIENEMTM